MIIAIVLALALAIGIALWLSRRIVGGVQQVLTAAEGISEGDLDQQVDARTRDEIGQMATAFGRMKIQFCHAVSRPKTRVCIVSGPAKRRLASMPVSASGERLARSSMFCRWTAGSS